MQTSCFSKSAAFLRRLTHKPQSLEKHETLRYQFYQFSQQLRAYCVNAN
jgi:hypothetical protein